MRSESSAQTGATLHISPRWLPFADAATHDLPMARILRLALFQVTAGMALVLLNGTLNRVMVVELGMPVWAVSLMVALPMLLAPLRALIGHRSDQYRSYLGWRRVPFIWAGTLAQFGGFAIMPFALILMSAPSNAPIWLGPSAAALAFLLVGAGMHTAQTAGLALATDLAPESVRPRVVALLYVMLLCGMIGSSFAFSWLLDEFSYVRLIKVIQGAAVVTVVLNVMALWKQEARQPELTRLDRANVAFGDAWREVQRDPRVFRLLVVVALGTLGFNMQDILLEPYGAEVLGLSVSATTALTAIFCSGMLIAFAAASRQISLGRDPARVAASGLMVGTFAFALVILSAPTTSATLFRGGTLLVGLGNGLFAVGTLSFAMTLADRDKTGLILGAWGAVQATSAGIAMFAGGALRDTAGAQFAAGLALTGASGSYNFVYVLEIIALFSALIAIGAMTRRPGEQFNARPGLRMIDFPG